MVEFGFAAGWPAAFRLYRPTLASRSEPDCIHRRIEPGEPPVLGIDGLLAVVADVRRLGEVQAWADNGGERCLEMMPCPLEPAGGGNRAGVGGVPGIAGQWPVSRHTRVLPGCLADG